MQEARRYRTGNTREVGDRIEDLLVRLSAGVDESGANVDEYFDSWLTKRSADLAPSTLHSYRLTHRYYISPYIGTARLLDVTVTSVSAWLHALLVTGGRAGEGLSAATVKNARVVLHKAFEDAVRSGELLVNPVARTQAPAKDASGNRQRYPASSWTLEELRTFLRAAEAHPLGPLFTVLATTGMRRSEALALSWRDVDFGRGEVVVERGLTVVEGQVHLGAPKRGRPRRIALGEHAVDALATQERRQMLAKARAGTTWSGPPGQVFAAANGSFLDPGAVTSAFKAVVRRLDVSRIRLHDLRHTHAILLLHAGVPIIDVSHRLGHADPGVTLQLYARALQNPGHAVAETFDRLLDERRWGTGRLAGALELRDGPLPSSPVVAQGNPEH